MMIAGRYYVGDLCYVMHDAWDEICDLVFDDNHGCIEGEFTLKDGRRFAMYNTAYGDGVYTDQYGREYSVDSGSIGCILLDDIRDESYDDERLSELANISDISVPFETGNNRGVIRIASLIIDTTHCDYEENE